eukprot:scaffold867_cov317-Pavlova_lutheri.AAC.61
MSASSCGLARSGWTAWQDTLVSTKASHVRPPRPGPFPSPFSPLSRRLESTPSFERRRFAVVRGEHALAVRGASKRPGGST